MSATKGKGVLTIGALRRACAKSGRPVLIGMQPDAREQIDRMLCDHRLSRADRDRLGAMARAQRIGRAELQWLAAAWRRSEAAGGAA